MILIIKLFEKVKNSAKVFMDTYTQEVHPVDSYILPGSRYNLRAIKEEIERNPLCKLEYLDTTNSVNKKIQIPVLFYSYPGEKTDLYTLYFHGNGENIVEQMYFYEELTKYYKSNIVAMEYTGYALYQSNIVDSQQIKADAVTTFDYLVQKMGIHPDKIIVFGRSIGSGPASYLASQRKCGAVIIFSGFSSLNWVPERIKAKSIDSSERFDNLGCVKLIKSPTLIIHGTKDHILNVSHAKELEAEFIKHSLAVKSHYDEEMQHNYYSFEKLAEYINQFTQEYKIVQ